MSTDYNTIVSRSASDGQLTESPSFHPANNDDGEFVVTTLPHPVRTRTRSRSNSNSRHRSSFFERRSLITRNRSVSGDGYVTITNSDADTTNETYRNNHEKVYVTKATTKDKQQREKAFKKSSSLFHSFLDLLLPRAKPRHSSKKFPSQEFHGGERIGNDVRPGKATSTPILSNKRESNSPNAGSGSGSGSGPVATRRAAVGVTGIRNHGNTCYMNAVLQCLSHTDTLAEYFVMDQYKVDLRKRSRRNAKKYGTKGEVTEQLAKLLKCLWSSRDTCTAEISNQFKIVVGNHNEGFKGSEQNDAQEFLIWLLDRVHEDLNTGDKKKKSNKIFNNQSKHGEDLAAVSLANHQRRNISFVNEIFRAQFQSSVTCHNCQKLSITYDPFLCISVPIPQRQTRPVYCTVVYLERKPKQVKMGVSVIAHGNIQDLRETLSKETGIAEKQMIITEIHEENFGRTFADIQPISAIRDSDNVYVVETPVHKPTDQEEHLLLLWINRLGAGMQGKRFGCPYTAFVRRMNTYDDVQSIILKEMKDIANAQVIETVSEAIVRLRVVDGLDGKCYLPDDVEHPLYVQTVDEALATAQQEGHGPQHLKLNVEWDQADCDRMLSDVTDPVEDHASVDAHRNEQNLPINATLNECFELYLQAEELGVDNQWKCPNCMKHEQCMKKISLWSVPDILVIHLMRFRQTSSQRTKLDTLVEFPINGLDMSLHTVHRSFQNNESSLHHNGLGFLPWSPFKRNQRNFARGEDSNIYDLYGVCNHVGMLQSGHYTAYCKNPTDGLWYNFDDTKVQPIEESAIVTPSAYILFYQRRSMSSGCSSSDSTSSAGSEHWVHRMQPTHFHAKVSKSQDNLSALGREEKDKEKSKTSLRGTRPYASMGALNAHKRHEERKVRRESVEKAHYSDDEDADCYMMMPESSV